MGTEIGRRVRVRVLARDVSLATQPQEHTSIQNMLPGHVDEIVDDEHPGLALERVRVEKSVLIARMTKRSVAALCVTTGQAVWVQIKTVALME